MLFMLIKHIYSPFHHLHVLRSMARIKNRKKSSVQTNRSWTLELSCTSLCKTQNGFWLRARINHFHCHLHYLICFSFQYFFLFSWKFTCIELTLLMGMLSLYQLIVRFPGVPWVSLALNTSSQNRSLLTHFQEVLISWHISENLTW